MLRIVWWMGRSVLGSFGIRALNFSIIVAWVSVKKVEWNVEEDAGTEYKIWNSLSKRHLHPVGGGIPNYRYSA